MRLPLVVGACCALVGVMAGAFGAHGLRGIVSERGLEVFQTAVTYQMYHAIALVMLSVLSVAGLNRRLLSVAAGFFLAGILLFSGSLYTLVLTDIRWIGPVTPLGGVCFMVAWTLLAVAGLRRPGSGQGKEQR
ncbi:DUF423 domain-containing protein [Marinobacter sp. M216]|uniref:DUF423 domain-containing protein n=1 Tax=Marinobacter albus TaxID=3030833 RepID=A0ABT7HA27_9GAMM|nr:MULTISPECIES: DUF423 domain-containing protein [unclassified Marinobacter]MBW7471321.1 DUF423 domain-containing protein [Marinobacter sp. F4218]MDK9556401.1 DUF423 domain-containing protein [Marinobacter sp. M216]